MKPLNTCCLCCSLEVGAYILGAIGTVLSISSIIFSSLIFEKVIKWHVLVPTLTSNIVLSVISLICFVLLLWGTKKRKSSFLIPYLVVHMIGLIFKFIGFITYLASTSHQDNPKYVPFYFGYTIALTLGVYIEVCIYSLFLKMKDEKLSVGTYTQFEA